MQLEGAKLATYHAARLYDQSAKDSSISPSAVGVAANTAKFLAAEAAFTACERSVLAMGGMGYAAEFHVERYMRDCFVPRIAPVSRVSATPTLLYSWEQRGLTQTQEMIMNFIAEKALGLPKSY